MHVFPPITARAMERGCAGGVSFCASIVLIGPLYLFGRQQLCALNLRSEGAMRRESKRAGVSEKTPESKKFGQPTLPESFGGTTR